MAGETVTIRDAIAERLKSDDTSTEVEEKIIRSFVDREVVKRSTAVVNVIDQIMKMESDLRKIKADVIAYNEDGSVASSNWSKPKLDEKKKLEEKIQKFQNAVNKAIEKDDFGDVYNLGSGKAEASD